MGMKIVVLGFTIALCTVALALPAPFLIVGAILAVIGTVLLMLDK